MHRRTLLHVAGTAVTVGLAGCSSQNTTASSSTTAEESAVDSELRASIMEFVTAFNDEDKQAIIDAYHPNSPHVPSRDNIYFRSTFTVDKISLVEQSSDAAIVQANVTLTDDSSEAEQVVHTYELRPNDGEWDIYLFTVGTEIPETGSETEEGTENSGTPSVTFSTNYQASRTDGSATGVVTITHAGGDPASGSNLYIQGTGISAVEGPTPDVTAPETQWATATGTDTITAGDSITIGVTDDYDISVVWQSGGSSTTLITSSGPA